MKKSFRVCILFAVCISVLMLFATNVSADMGPKPSITINTNGTVGEKYYLDLLVDYDSEYKNLSEEDISELDPEMYKTLSEYTDGTWYPAIAHGTHAPLFGTIVPDSNGSSHFSYFGTPDKFKVIIVTESGIVKVSDVVEKTVYQQIFSLDFADMKVITGQSPAKSYLLQFVKTFIPTVIIEVLLLLAFRLPIKKYIVPVLIVNFVTQLCLAAVLVWCESASYFTAIPAFIAAEIMVTIIEAIAYIIIMKKERLWKRIVYAVTATIASAIIGELLVTIIAKTHI